MENRKSKVALIYYYEKTVLLFNYEVSSNRNKLLYVEIYFFCTSNVKNVRSIVHPASASISHIQLKLTG